MRLRLLLCRSCNQFVKPGSARCPHCDVCIGLGARLDGERKAAERARLGAVEELTAVLREGEERLALVLGNRLASRHSNGDRRGRIRVTVARADVTLVVANDAQASEVYDLVSETLADTLAKERGIDPSQARMQAWDSCRRAIAECGDRKGVFSIIETSGGQHAGYVWVVERERADSKALHIFFLTVFPSNRRRGIGMGALQAIERMAKERGLDALTLHVSPLNTSALRMYRKAGFEPYPSGMVLRLKQP